MKKLKMVAFAILASLFVVSCTKDDEPTTQVLLSGKWEFMQTGNIDSTGNETLYNWIGECDSKKDYIQFLVGNVLRESYYYTNCTQTTDYNGTWSFEDKTITVVNSEIFDSKNLEIVELTATTLKVKFPYRNNKKIVADGAPKDSTVPVKETVSPGVVIPVKETVVTYTHEVYVFSKVAN